MFEALRAAERVVARQFVEVDGDAPIGGEVFSRERLQAYATELAASQRVAAAKTRGRDLLMRLEENGRTLVRAYNHLTGAVGDGQPLTPAAEWLVDNFHIVEEQLREVRQDLPRSFYAELPKLDAGAFAGLPRIYHIALEVITHTDNRLDAETLRLFLNAYQERTALTIGELWAFPISLRLALVENLRRYTALILAARFEREAADKLADNLVERSAEDSAGELLNFLTKNFKGAGDKQLSNAYVVQLAARLRDGDATMSFALETLEKRLRRAGRTVENLAQIEHRRQAAAQVSVANIITSMRLLSTLDWRDFFESVSLVDRTLREDPAGAYAAMDFATRDEYRHTIERIAKRTRASETAIARRAVDLASRNEHEGSEQKERDKCTPLSFDENIRRSHVGYFLISSDGVRELERAFAYRPIMSERTRRWLHRHPTLAYLTALALLTASVVAALASYAVAHDARSWLALVAIVLVALVPASELALAIVNRLVTLIFKPHLLPKMNLSGGIPLEARTVIVIPTQLTDEETVGKLCERLEVYYLANRDEQLFFALLGDLADAAHEEMPQDATLREAARAALAELNRKYAAEGYPRFLCFTRRRVWNAGEGKWMCRERKRGNLHEFNGLLRGKLDTSFVFSQAADTTNAESTMSFSVDATSAAARETGENVDFEFLKTIRYCITLDADTQLPRDAARRLVGTIIHPLNRPHFRSQGGRVTAGYGILQPRIEISLTSALATPFARIFSACKGVDPYTTAVSDVYQDLFVAGSYVGKGLYDVDAFEAALDRRIPENKLLSHDLFEGLYARVGLVTDIVFYDDYPAGYDAYAKRLHRWARGDWQIARWLLPFVPDARGRTGRNPLPVIARWKIFDNLRRSLIAPALLVWLALAWTMFPASPLVWTAFALLALVAPLYAHLAANPFARAEVARSKQDYTGKLKNLWVDVRASTIQLALRLTFLAHEAYMMTDAVWRTGYRKVVTRRHLLQWVTAARQDQDSLTHLRGYMRFMFASPAIALVMFTLAANFHHQALIIAAPFLLLWCAAPFIAFRLSGRARGAANHLLTNDDTEFLRLVARRTWRYFETFVEQSDHWLPPDNFQEEPQPVIAHRTSPTNIGLLLLSTAAARDFGYTGTLECVERLELTCTTLERLPRFRGHFLNWYDTRTLEPLAPRYVSTVDSGNLAGHLIAVSQSCRELPDAPLFDERTTRGFADALALLSGEIKRLEDARTRVDRRDLKGLHDEVGACIHALPVETPQTMREWRELFELLMGRASTAGDIVNALAQEHGEEIFGEVRYWLVALSNLARACSRDLQTFAPYVALSHEVTLLESRIQKLSAETFGRWQELKASCERVPVISRLTESCDGWLLALAALQAELRESNPPLKGSDAALAIPIGARKTDAPVESANASELDELTMAIESAAEAAKNFVIRAESLAHFCSRLMAEMDFAFLYDDERKVLTIGYRPTEAARDTSFYDLLASEARLASFIAIASGDVEQEHWFRLGRALVTTNGDRALVSWSGTMFEYLMPLLVMRDYGGTLLAETYRAVVHRQIRYGAEHNVAWGVSESAYNARDLQFNYQYAPFGVPGLGLKRGLAEDLVVAPYATFLAAAIDPQAAVMNLRRLAREGLLGHYGFYESVDYTRERLPPAQTRAVIAAYMTHHQGMNLVALDNLLHDDVMQRRFHREPMVEATELLLQERVPRASGAPAHPRAADALSSRRTHALVAPAPRVYDSADQPSPRVCLLSNGSYTVMLTTAGSGYSVCGGRAVTRWREDGTRDHWGSFCYLHDVRSGAIWSSGFQPTLRAPQTYEVKFTESKADIRRRDAGITTHTEIIVTAEDDAELRRISVTNESARAREIELTSYAEVVLNAQAADEAHPAFVNLFVETEFLRERATLIARRRPRSPDEEEVFAAHSVAIEGEIVGVISSETDRVRFLGRGQTTASPHVINADRPLANIAGATLDPIFSLRVRVRLAPNATARINFSTLVAASRERALELADKYRVAGAFERATKLSWTRAQVERRHFGITADEANLFQSLAGRLIYSDANLRPRPNVLRLNTGTQKELWKYGIGGDLPLLIVRVGEGAEARHTLRQMLRAHEYLRAKNLHFDLLILNDQAATYSHALDEELQAMIRASGSHAQLNTPGGGVFLRRTDIMPEADRILLHTVARAVLVTERGSIEEQLARRTPKEELPPPLAPRKPPRRYADEVVPAASLDYWNGFGGFAKTGREYRITLTGDMQLTPAPWANVIANNADFGFLVTEAGGGFTWAVNSRENRLTSWSNDVVSDTPGECIYLRDEDTGSFWTPTALPIREASPYNITHGQGYSLFEHTSHGIRQELLVFAPLQASVKISRLRLQNRTEQKRRLSVTNYSELVLGVERAQSSRFVVTEIDAGCGAIFARNLYNNEFAALVAFSATSADERTWTCDRREFIGRNGTPARPAALLRANLSGASGAGLDPCAALQTVIELQPNETREIIFLLGEEDSAQGARAHVERFRQPAIVEEAFRQVTAFWDDLLGAVEVSTPDASMNLLMNRWLVHQTLACRMWARSAFYQSSGAYGFRDQLQDAMAILYARPDISRAHILRAAARQFKEGDVQHWWHEPTGRGVRTRSSDDLLWLVYVTCFYVEVTDDAGVLNEVVPFLEAPLLAEGEDESYSQPLVSSEQASLYEHCVRAVDRSLRTGVHGLPLMGAGDWNDGMNRVGNKGSGESIWLGWFLFRVLENFAGVCERQGNATRAAQYRAHMQFLKTNLEEHAWDGDWYLRAFFDDGTPLGSHQNDECQIDAIAQSWSVISGAGREDRARRAMQAVEERLIRRGDGLLLLFAPPFDRTPLEPGYIKGYVPGVRENGGQYTHAAAWTLIAYALLGEGDKAANSLR